ncbi:MAG: hypothetical protein JO117_07120 [Verrucomicrobia bacterium]|nr:hypothetical protein [Verrucomicrobiota bacterium]
MNAAAPGNAEKAAWHFLSPEYPPQRGGVGDVARAIARQFAENGGEVHVWTGRDAKTPAGQTNDDGVRVHRLGGNFGLAGIRQLHRGLDAERFPPRRRLRLFLHWVPHGYGMHSLNLFLPLWLLLRAWLRRDHVDVFIHEPGVDWSGKLRERVAAAVHRAMLLVLLLAARRVWLSTPAWHRRVLPWLRLWGKAKFARTPVRWRPLRLDLPVVASSAESRAAYRATLGSGHATLLGHFGTFGEVITGMLTPVLERVCAARPEVYLLLLGRGSQAYCQRLASSHPHWAGRLHFLDGAEGAQISMALSACDLLLQPFPDGVTTRRTSVLAGLAHGRAIISNPGHLTELTLWREAGAVHLVTTDEKNEAAADAWAKTIGQLLADSQAREALATRGRNFYNKHFVQCDYRELLEENPLENDASRSDNSSHPSGGQTPI